MVSAVCSRVRICVDAFAFVFALVICGCGCNSGCVCVRICVYIIGVCVGIRVCVCVCGHGCVTQIYTHIHTYMRRCTCIYLGGRVRAADDKFGLRACVCTHRST